MSGQFPSRGAVGGVFVIPGVIFGSGRRGWRVAVTPYDVHVAALRPGHAEMHAVDFEPARDVVYDVMSR